MESLLVDNKEEENRKISKWMRKGRKVEREREERLPWKDKVEEEEARK